MVRVHASADRDVSTQASVRGTIHLSHAAGANRGADFVDAEPAAWMKGHAGVIIRAVLAGRRAGGYGAAVMDSTWMVFVFVSSVPVMVTLRAANLGGARWSLSSYVFVPS
jgi:hypothetical protein